MSTPQDDDRRLASLVARQRREIEALLARNHDLAQRLRKAEAEIEKVYASTTWKVGDTLLGLPKKVKETLKERRVAGGQGSVGRMLRGGRTIPDELKLAVEPSVDEELLAEYRKLVGRRTFDGDGTAVVFLVSTTDFDEGRGDLFVAAGLGRALEQRGVQTMFLPPQEWYDLPSSTDVVVSMLAEERMRLDPLRVPQHVSRIAWIRNNAERWLDSPTLGAYDGVLCSSEWTLERVREVFPGPTAVLRIGVDEELFRDESTAERRGVVSTVNQWGSPARHTYEGLASRHVQFPMAIFGVQRELHPDLRGFQRGLVSYFAMPSLYREARLVLDDQQSLNAPFGNVNSRIYESLAAGALPITNTHFGIDEVGLADLPVAEEPEDLQDVVERLLDDPEGTAALTQRLRAHVLAEHTYARRAETLEGFLAEVREAGATSVPVVGFLPDYSITNPYQPMLYQALRHRGAIVTPVRDGVDLATLPGAAGRPLVLHVHWTATILGPAKDEADARSRARNFVEGLDLVRGHGGRIVWTIHNAMPHECAHPEVERWLRQAIADRADLVHVMCEATSAAIGDQYTLPADRTVVVPHGSYVDVYPDVVDRRTARASLGLDPTAPTALFLGQIRPYKGIERLLDAFRTARRTDPRLQLVIAGQPGRFEGVQDLLTAIERAEGVHAYPEEVPDEELQVYFRAADVTVLPHERVLNSGAALLSLSYGRAVIAPDTGCLPSVVTPDVGRTFVGTEGLAEALGDLTALTGDEIERRCYERARGYTAADMSRDFADALERVVASTAEGAR